MKTKLVRFNEQATEAIEELKKRNYCINEVINLLLIQLAEGELDDIADDNPRMKRCQWKKRKKVWYPPRY